MSERERSSTISRSSLSSIYGTSAHRSARFTFRPAPLRSKAGFKEGVGQTQGPIGYLPANRGPLTTPADLFIYRRYI